MPFVAYVSNGGVGLLTLQQRDQALKEPLLPRLLCRHADSQVWPKWNRGWTLQLLSQPKIFALVELKYSVCAFNCAV